MIIIRAMTKPETLEEFIERSAQANVQALIEEGALDPNDTSRMDRAILLARIIKKGSEEGKMERKFTVTSTDPFVGCNAICSLQGRAVGSIEGPNDFCKIQPD